MRKSGFTLVELLVAVTIMAIIGVASIGGFSHLSDLQDSKTTQEYFLNSMSELDDAVRDHEISSYEVSISSWSIGYTAEKDFYGRDDRMLVESFDFENNSGTATTHGTSTGSWQVALWSDGRYQWSETASASGSVIGFSFSWGCDNYDLIGMIDSKNLNAFSFRYFSSSASPAQDQVRLVSLSGSTMQYPTVIIRNVLGKKEMYWSGSSLDPLDSVNLGFEKNGKDITVELKK